MEVMVIAPPERKFPGSLRAIDLFENLFCRLAVGELSIQYLTNKAPYSFIVAHYDYEALPGQSSIHNSVIACQ